MQFSSNLLANAVEEFAKLPGIGKKSALRAMLFLLKQNNEQVERFSKAILDMKHHLKFCKQCGNLSDDEMCSICTDSSRNGAVVCVVETIRNVIAIENTQQFNGLYHVLGGVISPLDGVDASDLNIASLLERVSKGTIQELVFALNPNIEGDTTIFYIEKKLPSNVCKITSIARGVAFGGELEYADDMTLARSITNRLPIKHYVH